MKQHLITLRRLWFLIRTGTTLHYIEGMGWVLRSSRTLTVEEDHKLRRSWPA